MFSIDFWTTGLNIGQYFAVFGDMPAAWQLVVTSILISTVFLGSLLIFRSVMRMYFTVKEGVQWCEEMKELSQNITQPQMKALLLLKRMGENKYLHPNGNPYKEIIHYITGEGKTHVANPDYYLDTIEGLIPKPPKPVILAEKGMKK